MSELCRSTNFWTSIPSKIDQKWRVYQQSTLFRP